MAEKTTPWWRRALNFALEGLRTGFGLFIEPAPEAAATIAEKPAAPVAPKPPRRSEPTEAAQTAPEVKAQDAATLYRLTKQKKRRTNNDRWSSLRTAHEERPSTARSARSAAKKSRKKPSKPAARLKPARKRKNARVTPKPRTAQGNEVKLRPASKVVAPEKPKTTALPKPSAMPGAPVASKPPAAQPEKPAVVRISAPPREPVREKIAEAVQTKEKKEKAEQPVARLAPKPLADVETPAKPAEAVQEPRRVAALRGPNRQAASRRARPAEPQRPKPERVAAAAAPEPVAELESKPAVESVEAMQPVEHAVAPVEMAPDPQEKEFVLPELEAAIASETVLEPAEATVAEAVEELEPARPELVADELAASVGVNVAELEKPVELAEEPAPLERRVELREAVEETPVAAFAAAPELVVAVEEGPEGESAEEVSEAAQAPEETVETVEAAISTRSDSVDIIVENAPKPLDELTVVAQVAAPEPAEMEAAAEEGRVEEPECAEEDEEARQEAFPAEAEAGPALCEAAEKKAEAESGAETEEPVLEAEVVVPEGPAEMKAPEEIEMTSIFWAPEPEALAEAEAREEENTISRDEPEAWEPVSAQEKSEFAVDSAPELERMEEMEVPPHSEPAIDTVTAQPDKPVAEVSAEEIESAEVESPSTATELATDELPIGEETQDSEEAIVEEEVGAIKTASEEILEESMSVPAAEEIEAQNETDQAAAPEIPAEELVSEPVAEATCAETRESEAEDEPAVISAEVETEPAGMEEDLSEPDAAISAEAEAAESGEGETPGDEVAGETIVVTAAAEPEAMEAEAVAEGETAEVEEPAVAESSETETEPCAVVAAGTESAEPVVDEAEAAPSGPEAVAAESPAPEEEATEPAPVENETKPAHSMITREVTDDDPFAILVNQVYEGPLDLLLDLIRKQDIDIYDIPIAKITQQFLAYVNRLKATDVDTAGEFIYMASLLIHIKSKMLLPRLPSGADDSAEDPRRELVERLLEHERFKNAAQMLLEKQMIEAATWTNPGMREFKAESEAEPEIAADTTDLVRIFQEILDRARNRPVINVEEDTVTVGQMIQFLSRRLTMEDKPIALRRLLSHTRSERALIAMFLALLELVRMQAILLRQDRAFSEIFIKKHTGFEAVMNQSAAGLEEEWR